MESLTEYMKKELMFYIKQEYDKGTPMTHIRRALLDGGHHQDLVREAMKSLKKNKYNLAKSLTEPIKKDLDKVLYFNIINSLVKYIEYQLSIGRSMEDIKKILEKYGHSEKIIKAAFNRVNKTRPIINNYAKYVEIALGVAIILIAFFVAGIAREPLDIVLIGFSPVIFTIIATIISAWNDVPGGRLWFAPAVFNAGYLGAYLLHLAPIAEMEVGKLLAFNIIYSFIYVAVVVSRSQDMKKVLDTLHEEVSPEDVKTVKESDLKEKKKGRKKKGKKGEIASLFSS